MRSRPRRSARASSVAAENDGRLNLKDHAAAVTFDVLAQPRASRSKIGPLHDGRSKVAVTAPPIDGEANAASVDALSERLDVACGAIEVIAGQSSRRKTVRIEGISRAASAAIEALAA